MTGKTPRIWLSVVRTLPLLWLGLAAPEAAAEGRYSGTVVAVDAGAGKIVVEGMGPWTVKHGQTQLERWTFRITPSTQVVRVRRAEGVAPSGWTRDWVEAPLAAPEVKPGDWVTTVTGDDDDRTAVRILVIEPSDPVS
jgi:hypothetical protein